MAERAPAYEKMRLVVETLSTGADTIRARGLAAARCLALLLYDHTAGLRTDGPWPRLKEQTMSEEPMTSDLVEL